MKSIFKFAIAVFILGILILVFSQTKKVEDLVVSNFQECAEHYPVMESFPEQCATPDGRTFVRDVDIAENRKDVIEIEFPKAGSEVSSPLSFSGQARGQWFFEASFPVLLLDAEERVLAQTPAITEGEWMTEDFVPFDGVLNFETPATKTGVIVFEKSNASGLSEQADEIRIPVIFKEFQPILEDKDKTAVSGECRPTGCSGQVCADEEVITTCEFRAEYACYEEAVCERQEEGECGWTETEELLTCLDSPPNL